MTALVLDSRIWSGREVLVTGHSGFKGWWLAHWLYSLGAQVHGLSLDPTDTNAFFYSAGVTDVLSSDWRGDIRDVDVVRKCMSECRPSVVLHLAAQPLVRDSYRDPLGTLATNVMGTANVLDAVRVSPAVEAVLVVTTDKVYTQDRSSAGYRESDRLGGEDPYSASKAAAELVTESFEKSFLSKNAVAVATARAGNVIGGGDWGHERLVPDLMRSLSSNSRLDVRNRTATRPWQHVLEPLAGYLMFAERMLAQPETAPSTLNFGPSPTDFATVEDVVSLFSRFDERELNVRFSLAEDFPEAKFLSLDNSEARRQLGWFPRWNLQRAVEETLVWYRESESSSDMANTTQRQIKDYSGGQHGTA